MIMSEEDKKLVKEASTCNDCVSWHKHCQAECCRMILLESISPKELDSFGKYVGMRQPITPSMQRYYNLHDVSYVRGLLRFRKDRCRVIGTKVVYIHDCSLLDENFLCKGHPDNKPLICKYLTIDTAAISRQHGIALSKNCLFKYKILEDDCDDKKN
jgi:hypothetical protein